MVPTLFSGTGAALWVPNRPSVILVELITPLFMASPESNSYATVVIRLRGKNAKNYLQTYHTTLSSHKGFLRGPRQ